ncbi:MAG: hypothetical protein K6G38_03440 [Gammaproteobacteria bacterium]|nr:hypothetical protein [Gammaproteobacteria bacterium]
MKVHIYPIYSPLHNEEFMENETKRLLTELSRLTNFEYRLVGIDELYQADLPIILVESGGSEHYFKEVFDKLKEPIYLLTFGNNNSLAASLEILSYLQNKGLNGEIFHGSDNYIAERILRILGK